MIELCIFDMGGVLIRDFHIAPRLLPFLGCSESSFAEISPAISEALKNHSRGLIDEPAFWEQYRTIVGRALPETDESLLGKFFTPVLDPATVDILRGLKAHGMRVVCGTNVIDAHYDIHMALKQYDIFDHVYASHLIHIAKPDGDFYRYICEQEHVSPENAFFTDDMEANVVSARQEGLAAFLYTDAKHLGEQLGSLGVLY